VFLLKWWLFVKGSCARACTAWLLRRRSSLIYSALVIGLAGLPHLALRPMPSSGSR